MTDLDEIKKALDKNKKAKDSFDKFTPSSKKMIYRWILRGKREETRTKRIKLTVAKAKIGRNDVFEAQQKIINEEHNRLNSKETLNNRMNNYAPLAKTIQYDTKQSSGGSGSGSGGRGRPKQWNPNDVNGTLKNVVYNQMPVLSNNEN